MKHLLILIMSCFSLAAFGQSDESDIRDLQANEKIRAAHAAYITQRIELTSAEAERFWPVYREYGEKRRKLRQEMRDARRGGHDGKTLLEMDLKTKQNELDLEKDYTERLQKIISPEKLLKLRQAEIDFRKLLLRQIQDRRRHRR